MEAEDLPALLGLGSEIGPRGLTVTNQASVALVASPFSLYECGGRIQHSGVDLLQLAAVDPSLLPCLDAGRQPGSPQLLRRLHFRAVGADKVDRYGIVGFDCIDVDIRTAPELRVPLVPRYD